MSEPLECAIIGAGPAGLAAGTALGPRAKVFDSGPPMEERRRGNEEEAIAGVGGAGLYSDGKFSYFPSATNLWTLDPKLLHASETWLERITRDLGIPFRGSSDDRVEDAHVPGQSVKAYPSFYASIDQRIALTAALREESNVSANLTVQSVVRGSESWALTLSDNSVTHAKRVLLASGRFGPIETGGPMGLAARQPRRLEVGVRVEQPSDAFFLRDSPLLDPKVIWRGSRPGLEWRTFCCCREGEVVTTLSGSIRTHSGRGDCPPTGRSNVGFLVRTTDPIVVHKYSAEVIRGVSRGLVSTMSFERLIADQTDFVLIDFFGNYMGSHLAAGLRLLSKTYPTLTEEDTTVHVPCLEGVGWYPKHDSRLRANEDGVWVAGDCTGSFRGIVAALISGRLAGSAILEEIDN